jgi:hypothetical protein
MIRAIICTTDGPDKGCTTWDHDQHVDARHALDQDPNGWGSEYGAAAMDEIERLRDLTTITDDKVEKAAIQMCATDNHEAIWLILFPEEKDSFRADARAVLEAALNPPA